MNSKKENISPDMTVLDIVSKYSETVEIFKNYDKQAGECICCCSLFETLEEISEKYDIDLKKLLDDLCNHVEIQR
jgi:iron-sulfur cluster repair protein YtfE (RIC family)